MQLWLLTSAISLKLCNKKETFKCVIMRNSIKVKMQHKVIAVKHEKLLMWLKKKRKFTQSLVAHFLSPCLFPFLCCLTDCWFLFHLFSHNHHHQQHHRNSLISPLFVACYSLLDAFTVGGFYSSKAGAMEWKEINDVFYRQHHLKSLNSPTFFQPCFPSSRP